MDYTNNSTLKKYWDLIAKEQDENDNYLIFDLVLDVHKKAIEYVYNELIEHIDEIRPKVDLVRGINNKEGYVSKQAIFDYFEKYLLPINDNSTKKDNDKEQ